ncbi:MAG: hypothetical protein IKR76_10780 [Ruminococcus sp.]|nr:hypothetical protein [Ruminococcus sp.]
MQVSLARMKNNVRAEKQACGRIYELMIVLDLLIVAIVAFASEGALETGGTGYMYMCTGFPQLTYFPTAVLSLILGVKLFRDMQSSTQADVILSLPMNSKERYFSKILTYLRLAVLPYICTALVSSVAAVIADKLIYENKGLSLSYYAKGLSVFFLGGLCIIMYIGAVSFICCSFSSSIAGAAASSVLMGAAFAVICTFFLGDFLQVCAGVEIHNGYTEHFFFALEPVVYMTIGDQIWEADLTRWLVGTAVNILISSGAVFLGYIVYKKRDKGSLTYNVHSKPFILVLIALTGMAAQFYEMFSAVSYMPYAVLIVGLMLYAALLWRGGFKLKKCAGWLIGYAGTVAAFIVILAAAYFTDGFGFGRHPCYYADTDRFEIDITHNYTYEDEEHISLYQFDNAYISDTGRADMEDIISVVEKYTYNEKSFGSFCDLTGLRSKSMSENYDFRLMEYADDAEAPGDISSGYALSPIDYDNLSIYVTPLITDGGCTAEALAKAGGMYINAFIKHEDFEPLVSELKDRYNAEVSYECVEHFAEDDDYYGDEYADEETSYE